MTTPDRFVAGAIDLGEVKARAEARAQASRQPPGRLHAPPRKKILSMMWCVAPYRFQ